MNNANLKLLAKKLGGIKAQIKWADREDAAKALGRSVNSVNNYLNNRVRDEVFAADLLKFFKDRISERDAKAEEILND